jgi:hypothetical protein
MAEGIAGRKNDQAAGCMRRAAMKKAPHLHGAPFRQAAA